MAKTTEKTPAIVEETAPSASTLIAEETAPKTTEEATAEKTPAAAEDTAPVAPVEGETPAEKIPTTEEPTAEKTPVESGAGETPSTPEEGELPSGTGGEDIGGTTLTASTMSGSTSTRSTIKKVIIATLATGAVILAALAGCFGLAGQNRKDINAINAANKNNGGNNSQTQDPVDHDAEAIAKGKSTIDGVLAGYPGYTNLGNNYIQNNGTSTTVYFKMENKTNKSVIILPLEVSGCHEDTFDGVCKYVGDLGEMGEMLISIGDVYKSIDTYKEANPASAEAIDSIAANVNKVVGEGTVYVKSSSKQVNSGINMTTRFYVEGLGDKIGFSEYVKEKTAETENKFINKMDRAMKGGYPGGRFALDKDVSSEIEAKIAEINKPVEQPATQAEGETGAETEDPNASI